MTFRTSQRADADIADAFATGVLRFGEAQAGRYQDGLFATLRLLAANPRMAPERHIVEPPVRLHPYKAHMIVDIEDGTDILIIRVLHGRRDWERALS